MPPLETLEEDARIYCSLMGLDPEKMVKQHGNRYKTWQISAMRLRELLAVFEVLRLRSEKQAILKRESASQESPTGALSHEHTEQSN